jgi:uncharacterized repeat protein (TIGR01451 family)
MPKSVNRGLTKAALARGSHRAPWFRWLARGSALAVTTAALLGMPSGARAATSPVPLGTAANFAVLAGSTITNTGATTINGDLGLSPGTSVRGFPPGQVNGTIHAADSAALQAQDDLTAAYSNAAARTVSATIPVELGGTTQTPGVYDSTASTFGITGTLTLDAQGDPNAVFIFKAASTLTTASESNVSLVNGAQASNVFWLVGSPVTLGANSTLQGSLLALTSITVTTGTTINGRALARNGAVTLDTATITALFPALTSSITALTSSTAPGDTVHYTITIANTGQTADGGATLTDSLTGVLDDATYNNDAAATTGTVSFATPDLTWTGDLSVGTTVTITYSVSAKDPATGNLNLANTVSSAAPGSNCLPGSTDPQCSSSIPVVLGVLSITAPASATLGSAAPGGTSSASVGIVQVTDERAGVDGWTATTSATDLTTGGGTRAETIPVGDVQYLISGFTSTTGSATLTRTHVTDLAGTAQAVVTATNVNGDNSAAWNPVIQVSVPRGAVGGTYSATITHSVA